MAEAGEDIRAFLDEVPSPKRRAEAEKLLDLMSRATGESPRLQYGSVIGFGQYHYKYRSGREGDAPAAGFAPRKAAITIYLLDGVGRYGPQLEQLGPHTTGVGCLYVKDLDKVDLVLLEAIIKESFHTLTRDTYGLRAREGGHSG